MDLLGIMDITTTRQAKNGTVVWKLPIKCQYTGILIEVASFASGYVRNQGKSTHTNFQLNKRCESEPEYYEIVRGNGEKLYKKYTTRTCKLIPIEIDRLEYLISYCLKNYYIKNANMVPNGNFIPKWKHEWELRRAKEACNKMEQRADDFEKKEKYSDKYKTNKLIELRKEIRDLEEKLEKLDEFNESLLDFNKSIVTNEVSVTVNGQKYKVI
jgi:hypothetical protein